MRWFWLVFWQAAVCVSTAHAQKPEVFVQIGHTVQVSGADFSPDGKVLATVGADQVLKLWDTASGREMYTLAGHRNMIVSVSYSADGRLLATGGVDRTIKIWDAIQRREIRTLSGHTEPVLAVHFARAGEVVVSSADDGTIRVWEVSSGKVLRTLKPAKAQPSIWASPGGRLLAFADGARVVVWDLMADRELRVLHSTTELDIVSLSPDERLVAAQADGVTHVWEVATGRIVRSFEGEYGSLFTADGKHLILLDERAQVLKVRDIATGKEAVSIPTKASSAAAVSRDGRLIAAIPWINDREPGEIVVLYDARSGKPVHTLGGVASPIWSSALADDGRTLANGQKDGLVRVWDLGSGRLTRTLRAHPETKGGMESGVSALAFSPDGTLLATGSERIGEQATLKVWEVGSGRERMDLADLKGSIEYVAISPDNRLLAASGRRTFTKVWDIGTGTELRSIPARGPVAFSRDGQSLFVANGPELAQLDLGTFREIRSFKGHSRNILSLSLSPDANTLATASGHAQAPGDDSVRLWDIRTGAQLRLLQGHSSAVTSVAFSEDGRILVSTSYDRTARVWETASGREVAKLEGHRSLLVGASVLPGGRTVVSASWDGSTKVWDARSGKERLGYLSFTDGSTILISPEGYYDASSEQAEQNLNVRLGEQVTSIASFREKFFRPDLIKLALAGRPLDGYARLDDVKAVPSLEFTGVPSRTTEPELTIRLTVRDNGGGIGDLRLFLNGSAVRQEAARNLHVQAADHAATRSYTLRLVNGRNEIRAVAFNADNSAQSDPKVAELWATLKPARPSIHALVVGIQEFKNPRLALNYPIADARRFAEVLTRASSSLFQSVNVRLLTTPAETTRESLLQQMKEVRQRVAPEDLFIFFVASHGTVDDGEYFLITSNVGSISTDRLKTDALSQTDMKEFLANVPSTKKLIVIDTCNAGALGDKLQAAFLTRGMSEETAMKILGRAVGSTVLSASTSAQQALEGYQGHGLFTYVVTEGLGGKADLDKDGFVSTIELAAYVDEHVPALAEKVFRHAQYPIVSPSGQGFPLGRATH